MFFFLQRRRGFTQLTGVDYSDLAVMLAASVSRSEGFEDIQFMVFLLTAYSLIANYVMTLAGICICWPQTVCFCVLGQNKFHDLIFLVNKNTDSIVTLKTK